MAVIEPGRIVETGRPADVLTASRSDAARALVAAIPPRHPRECRRTLVA